MTPHKLQRVQACLAGVWAGAIVGIGAVAAPSLFSVLERPMAGRGAGQIFFVEARISLAMAVILFLLERRRSSAALAEGRGGSVMSPEILLILAALFLTVFGHFALQPMMEAARAGGPTPLSFGAVHGLSALMFWLKGAALIALAWRLTDLAPGPARQAAAGSSSA